MTEATEQDALLRADVEAASSVMLQKQLFVVFTEPVNGMGPVMENLEDHLAFQMSLENEGILWSAGPLWTDDETRWAGEGMVVIRAENLKHATEIAKRDPMHQRGARRFRIRPWMINEGRLTVKLDMSSQTFSLV